MKKNILFILPALIGMMLMSCEPQRDSIELGRLIDPSEVQLTVENTTPLRTWREMLKNPAFSGRRRVPDRS